MKADVTLLRKIGWRCFVRKKTGKPYLHPGVRDLPHLANKYLDHLQHLGAKVTM
jgi:hypothetical protein